MKKWRLREGGIKKDNVRQQLKGKEKRGIGDGEADRRDGGIEHSGSNRQGFMTGERRGCSGGSEKGRVFSSVGLWWRNEFCLWILLTPPQHNTAI